MPRTYHENIPRKFVSQPACAGALRTECRISACRARAARPAASASPMPGSARTSMAGKAIAPSLRTTAGNGSAFRPASTAALLSRQAHPSPSGAAHRRRTIARDGCARTTSSPERRRFPERPTSPIKAADVWSFLTSGALDTRRTHPCAVVAIRARHPRPRWPRRGATRFLAAPGRHIRPQPSRRRLRRSIRDRSRRLRPRRHGRNW